MTGIPEGVPTFLRFRQLLRVLQVDPLNEKEVRYVRGQLDRGKLRSYGEKHCDRLIYPGDIQAWADRRGMRLDWEGMLADEMKNEE